MAKVKIVKAKETAFAEISKAMRACQKKGIKIKQGGWGTKYDEHLGYFVPDKSCGKMKGAVCALGALLVHKNGALEYRPYAGRAAEVVDAAAVALGVDDDWVNNFTRGFDGDTPDIMLEDEVWSDKKGTWVTKKVKLLDAQGREYLRAYEMGKRLAARLKATKAKKK